MKSKKSEGLAMSMIIIAIIALAVLFIVIAIFTNVTEKTAKNIGNCETKGGLCADVEVKVDEKGNKKKPDGKCGGDYPIPLIVSSDCEKTTPKNLCCFKIKNEKKWILKTKKQWKAEYGGLL